MSLTKEKSYKRQKSYSLFCINLNDINLKGVVNVTAVYCNDEPCV